VIDTQLGHFIKNCIQRYKLKLSGYSLYALLKTLRLA